MLSIFLERIPERKLKRGKSSETAQGTKLVLLLIQRQMKKKKTDEKDLENNLHICIHIYAHKPNTRSLYKDNFRQ